MENENESARPTVATPLAKRRRVTGLTASRSGPCILSLPENVLQNLFERLCGVTWVAGHGSRDALNFASTCRELNNYYRYNVVVAVRLYVGPRTPPNVLIRALDRLPRVDTVELQQSMYPAENESIKAFLCVLRHTACTHKSRSMQSRTLGIKSLTLGRMGHHPVNESRHRESEVRISTECISSALEAFPSLERFDLSGFPAVGNNAVKLIAKHLSNSLQKLYMWHLEDLSDGGGAHIGKLRCLKYLQMRSIPRLNDVTVNALSALDELELLELSQSSTTRFLRYGISDAAVCKLLPHLRKLTVLDLSCCRRITKSLFSLLPPSLVSLELGHSGAISSDIPHSALEAVPNLISFNANGCRAVKDLSFAWPVAPRLKRLSLSGVGASDTNVANWVRRMVNLVELDLSKSVVSDETARAISSLGKITRVDLFRTKISNHGVRALAAGIACQSLEYLDLDSCTSISLEDGAVDALSRAISKRGYWLLRVAAKYYP